MIVLRTPVIKSNGLKGKGWWYVAKEYPDGTFTISTNLSRAYKFRSEIEADMFNQKHMQNGTLSSPFEVFCYESK